MFIIYLHYSALHQSTWLSGTGADRAVDKRYINTDLLVYGEQCAASDVRQTRRAGGWIKEE